MKKVYTASSVVDGTLLVNTLIEAGIPALLFNANAVGALGELPVTYPEVWIKRDLDEERSLQVIEHFDVTLNKQNQGKDILCQQCNEQNPASFEVCWNCATILVV